MTIYRYFIIKLCYRDEFEANDNLRKLLNDTTLNMQFYTNISYRFKIRLTKSTTPD